MTHVFVGRQPLLDRALHTIGYELLFRAGNADPTATIVDGDAATARVLLNAVTEIGLEDLVGDKLAFVNLTGHFLAHPDLLECLPPDRVVLEILEHVIPTDDVVAGLDRLAALGYTIALDDFASTATTEPLLERATLVKYDLSQVGAEELAVRIAADHAAGRSAVVERIEDDRDHAAAVAAGADYLQGYFFARPTTIASTSIAPNTVALIQLITNINQPDTTIDQIVEVLAQDVSMSVKVLRYVNAAAGGLAGRVKSIHHAAVLVGREHLRNWTTLSLMATIDDKPLELVRLALTRAKFCELVAQRRRLDSPSAFYTAGMLSLLDAMTDTPMETILDRIPVDDDIRNALLGDGNTMATVLGCAIDLEQHTDRCGTSLTADLMDAYQDAAIWATRLLYPSSPRRATAMPA